MVCADNFAFCLVMFQDISPPLQSLPPNVGSITIMILGRQYVESMGNFHDSGSFNTMEEEKVDGMHFIFC